MHTQEHVIARAMDHAEPDAPSLSSELWAKVFAHLEETPRNIRSWADKDERQHQAGVHQLKLVCKQFHEIYASHKGLVQALYLSGRVSASSRPRLLAWVQQNKRSVQTFRSQLGQQTIYAEVLEALVSLEPCLKRVGVHHISARSLSLLAAFTSLEECAFWQHDEQHLDLAPLRLLPSLSYLVLQDGRLKGLSHLTALTRLDCTEAFLYADCWHQIAPTLQHLYIEKGDVAEVLPAYFAPCTALTQLVLKSVYYSWGMYEVDKLEPDIDVVPDDSHMLTQLHTLDISMNLAELLDGRDLIPNLEWVFRLTSLEDLSIQFVRCLGNMLQNASLLTNLTRLSICGDDIKFQETREYDFDIEWHRLRALQTLSIRALTLHLGPGFAGLLQLTHLREVSFSEIILHGQSDNAYFAALIDDLAMHCPQVKVHAHTRDLLKLKDLKVSGSNDDSS